jgi:alpha-L-rhamnosidase
VNTTATVSVPAADISNVKESGKNIEQAEGVKFLRQENGKVDLQVGAGTYEFVSQMNGR